MIVSELDSLESVELALALEEELGNEALDAQEKALLNAIHCKARRSRIEMHEMGNQALCEVIVIGQSDSRVLFVEAGLKRFGVGQEHSDGIIRNFSFYHSLQRALFPFRQDWHLG